MALNKKQVEIPIIGGLDTKTDSKQVKLGKLLSAKNCVYTKPGKIMKRDGFSVRGQSIIDTGANMSDGQALMNYKGELLAFDKENIYSYVSATDNWKDKGNFQSIYLTKQAISNGTARDYMQDGAYYNGLECYVFMREIGAVKTLFYQINDAATKQNVIGPVPISTTAISPKVIVWQDQFVIYYYDTVTTTIKRGILSTLNLGATISFSSLTTAASNFESVNITYPAYEVGVMTTSTATDAIYLIFNNATSDLTGITIYRFDNPSSNAPLNTQQLTGADTKAKMFQVVYDPTNDPSGADGPLFVYVPVNDGAAITVQLYGYSTNLAVNRYTEGFYGPSANINYRCSVVSLGGSGATDRNIVVYGDYTQSTGRSYLQAWRLTSPAPGSISGTTLLTIQQMAIAAEAFDYNGRAYITAIGGADIYGGTTFEKTYFIINDRADAIGRFDAGLSPGPNSEYFNPSFTIPYVPSTEQVSDTLFISTERNVFAFGSVVGTTQTGISSYNIDFFEPERSYSRDDIANSLYIGGGMLYQYDGQSLVEDGFNWKPEKASTTVGNPGSTIEYQYTAIWEWVDNTGNLHRSLAANPWTVTTAAAIGSGGSNFVTTNLYPLSLTYKTEANRRSPVVCVLYRTKANDDVFFRLPTTSANNNNTTALYITPANDVTTDALLTEVLYDENELGNGIAPPVGAMTVHQNRLWVVDSTNPLQLYYSKQVGATNAVEWGEGQVLNIDPSGGNVVALASMDDKLLIFKERSIRYLSGDGPDALGQPPNAYNGTTLITTDAGCNNIRSVVNTPEGVIFKSEKGIYFINRGLQVSYIGAPVEKWNDDFVTSAVLMAKNNQVRITLDSGVILVYDYYTDNWATFTTLFAVDSVIWNGLQAFIRSVGKVYTETPGTYTDDGVSYPMEITTGWMAFSGIQGFQRLWAIHLLGEFKSAHKLQTQFYYNYNDAPSQTIVVSPIAPPLYGSGTPYGYPSPYGGTFQLYQYELRPAWEKCMSVKLSITDAVDGSTPLEEGYELSNLRLSYGVIGGSNRMKDSNIFG